MKLAAHIIFGLVCVLSPAHAQFKLSVIEGAACAQSAAHIEVIEEYNNGIYAEIGDYQTSRDRKIQRSAEALIVHFDRMVEFRKDLILQYEIVCARGTMTLTELRRVCRPQTSGVSFMKTAFCKPLRETGQ